MKTNYNQEEQRPEVRIYPETIVILLGIFIAGICIGAAIAEVIKNLITPKI